MTVQTVIQIDATHAHAGNIPENAGAVAGYDTGTPDIQWVPADWSRFPHGSHLHIDQSPSLAWLASLRSNVGDIENGAATIATLAEVAKARSERGHQTGAYISRSRAGDLVDALGALAPWVQLWLADWSLSQAEAAALIGTMIGKCRIACVQYASPTSNPSTPVPGSSMTLATAQCDLSAKDASWFPAPVATAVNGVVVTTGLETFRVTSDDRRTWVTT